MSLLCYCSITANLLQVRWMLELWQRAKPNLTSYFSFSCCSFSPHSYMVQKRNFVYKMRTHVYKDKGKTDYLHVIASYEIDQNSQSNGESDCFIHSARQYTSGSRFSLCKLVNTFHFKLLRKW